MIDESHNLRNREGKRYRAIQEYIQENVKASASCYRPRHTTKHISTYPVSSGFSFQKRKSWVSAPNGLLRDLGETEFIRRYQCPVRSLAAFEKSEYADDWRELMRLYMVRRTRSFIQDNYATLDPATNRKFLTFEDGSRLVLSLSARPRRSNLRSMKVTHPTNTPDCMPPTL